MNDSDKLCDTSVKKVESSYWTNQFLGRFATEQQALDDERLRKSCEFRIETTLDTFSKVKGAGVEGIDNMGKPFTGQFGDKNTLYLFTDMIKNMQSYIDTYEDKVGVVRQHRGMAIYGEYIAVLKSNDGTFPDYYKNL